MDNTILVDMDNTAFDFTKQYVKYHNKQVGTTIRPIDLKGAGYNFFSILGVSEEGKYNYLRLPKFFDSMPPMEGAVAILNKLHKQGINIIFTTTGVVPEAYSGKINCLKRYFKWFNMEDHLIMIKNKHLLKPAIIIDDNPHVIRNSRDHHHVIIFDDDWNQNMECDYRTRSWDDALYQHILNTIRIQNEK